MSQAAERSTRAQSPLAQAACPSSTMCSRVGSRIASSAVTS
ncbi:MAG: hypothetical protein RL005_87, partial [Planctomycetota bacterium]